ncbi:MAG: hypothetical protein LBN25_02640, partial [Christensenellaceae bacterium]|nr:hypothetical protein [Christensenellaceae bacterium]
MKKTKKFLLIILSVFLITTLGITLAACKKSEDNAGKSAYDLAVENGFEGTLDEWLGSLNGSNGANGTNGTNGINGENGTNAEAVNSAAKVYSDSITVDYKYLPEENVFTTLVYHDFLHLLSNPRVTPGEYIVLIGGTWDANTQGIIGLVDEVAKQQGIEEIYLFDPKLDAGLSQKIVGLIGDDAANSDNIGKVGYTYNGNDYLYDDLEVSKYKYSGKTLLAGLQDALGTEKLALNDDGTVKTPQLLVLNKAQESAETVQAIKAAALANPTTFADADAYNAFTAAKNTGLLYDVVPATATKTSDGNDYPRTYTYAPYQLIGDIDIDGLHYDGDAALVKTIFSKPTAEITAQLILPVYNGRDYFVPAIDSNRFIGELRTFVSENVNVNSLVQYDVFTVKNQAQASGGGTTRLTENVNADGSDKLFNTLTFEELVKLLETPGDHLVYWGGMWCPNSAVYYAGVKAEAIKAGYDGIIYLFDPKLDGNGQNIRSADSVATANASGNHSALYAYLLKNYITDYYSRWNSAGTNYKRILGSSDAASTAILDINGELYTRICVPNILLYNNAVEGGIVDSFESELSWGTSLTGTGGTANPESVSFKFRKTGIENVFAKIGVVESLTAAGYKVSVSIRGLEVYISAHKSDTDYVNITSYYYATPEDAATYP